MSKDADRDAAILILILDTHWIVLNMYLLV